MSTRIEILEKALETALGERIRSKAIDRDQLTIEVDRRLPS